MIVFIQTEIITWTIVELFIENYSAIFFLILLNIFIFTLKRI